MTSTALPTSSMAQARLHRDRNNLLAIWQSIDRRLRGWDVVVAMGLLALLSFSLPGREGPVAASGFDWIALAKLAIRVAVLAWFGSLALLSSNQKLLQLSAAAKLPAADYVGRFFIQGQWTSRLLLPWWCLLAWSLVTISWSALTTVSLGQWLGFAAMLAMAQVIAVRMSDGRISFTKGWRVLARQLNGVLAAYSFFVLIVHILAPSASGLDRSISIDGSNGFFHPTAVGAASSLGLTFVSVLFLRRVMTNLPAAIGLGVLHSVLLYLSQSRSALAMATVAGVLCFLFLMGWKLRAALLLGGGFSLLTMLVVDPGFEYASLGIKGATAYVQRGQAADQLQNVSGRAELWQLIWKEFSAAPVVGHGYFVTSSTGKLDVWGKVSNQDAHNATLQVLVTTGLVGGVLFAWAVVVSLTHLARAFIQCVSRLGMTPDMDFVLFMGIVLVWFVGWTQGCVAFFGPIRPEAVAFFALLGLLAAHRESASISRIPTRVATGQHNGSLQ